ncbi:Tetraspanin, EC2 domain [Lasallia pustulata]|uniref:Tetraspanin, EC2 domain n=1 Tax=Lasallia pustulata TaxID=136370 RepID=A0A1W5DEF3_9LECA|nr:Tetraspanin, EC2 domain [Lasallia pustulata]
MWQIIVAVLGALLGSAFTILGAYNWSRSTALSLPIPALANFLATIIPLLNYLCFLFTLKGPKTPTRIPPIEALGLLPLLDTILITLASSQLPHDAVPCLLDRRWRALFQAKNSRAIRSVQDSFNCCGFVSPVDKAWPFPDHEHGANACMMAFHRTKGCLASWRREEQMVLGVGITIGALSLLGKLVLLVLVRARPQLFEGVFGNVWQARGRQDQHGRQRMITGQEEGGESERVYFDNPDEEGAGAERVSGEDGGRALETS